LNSDIIYHIKKMHKHSVYEMFVADQKIHEHIASGDACPAFIEPQVSYCVHKGPPLVRVLSHTNLV